jgi:acetolactate synthase-1/2/3 large subunit
LRSCAEAEQIRAAVDLLEKAERGFLVCGQGAVTSGAWEAVTAVAEQFGLAVGTSIGGKGAISELHPLSVGVVGARGGTSFSNGVLADRISSSSWVPAPIRPERRDGHCRRGKARRRSSSSM